jgi:hypothetical protein
MIDIDSLKINKSVITPDYIFELATKARNDNADRSLLNNVPISMIDISLARINAEKGITTSEILKDKSPGTVLDLVEMIYNSNACQKPGAETSGQINVRENDITKRVING